MEAPLSRRPGRVLVPRLTIAPTMPYLRAERTMPPPPNATGSESPRPLSTTEAAVAERIARRIHAELREVLRRLPDAARGGTALSRYLDLHRSTCERVIAAASRREADASLLVRMPGGEGLRLFLEALREAELEESDLAGLETAVEELEGFIQEAAGSQARLKTRLALTSSAPEAVPGHYDPLLYHREALHEAAAAVTGRSTETQYVLGAYRRCPEDPAGWLEALFVKGYFGHRSDPGALPLLLVSGPTDLHPGGEGDEDRFRTVADTSAEGRSPDTVLRELTTDPLPMTTSRQREGGMLHTFVDPDRTLGDAPFDVVLAYRARSALPKLAPGDLHPFYFLSLLHYPARRLFMEMYLDPSLGEDIQPVVQHGMVPPPGMTGDLWAFRLGHPPHLEKLGSLPEGAVTDRFPEGIEILSLVFERIGWSLPRFTGWRCEIPYPIWQIAYQFSFDFPSCEG